MQHLIQKAAVLIEALPYIQEFRDSLIVVKFGGSAMENPEQTRSVLRDIVFMECVGMKPLIVHGGGKAISARMRAAGVEPKFVHGLRHTGTREIAIVDRVLHEEVNAGLVRMIGELGGHPCPVSGRDVLQAQRVDADDSGRKLDLGYVGRVAAVDSGRLQAILTRRQVPVVAPLGRGLDGQIYNINADMAACEIAAALPAHKLVFISDVPGILRDPGDEASLISTVRRREVDALISDGVISGGMVPKVRSAVAALDAGTHKLHLVDGRVRHSLLLEIFTDTGVGTQIVAD